MRRISKSFYGFKALDNVNFDLRKSEIHVILGENGAGKTTLVKILTGVYIPESGEIYIEGNRVEINSTKDAITHGIAMVNQYPQLIDDLSVADNIALSIVNLNLLSKTEKMADTIKDISKRYGFKINPDFKVRDLSFSERQRVEIIKSLLLDAKIIVMDEPTTLLTTRERRLIYQFMKRAKEEGKSIILITHKLGEALEIGDRITILRKGRVVDTIDVEEASYEKLMELMFNRSVRKKVSSITGEALSGETVLKVDQITVLDDYGRVAVDNVSFEVRKGEIFGITGIAGNGQKELVEALYNIRKPLKGKILYLNRDIKNFGNKSLRRMVGYIPDKIPHAVILDMPLYENAILKKYDTNEMIKKGMLINYKKAYEYTVNLINKFNIAAENPLVEAGTLSGGNLQKLVLAREISLDPRIIIAVNPSKTLDYMSTEFLYNMLLENKYRGKAILLISEDSEEVMKLADRIAVMYDGKLYYLGEKGEIDLDTIEEYMIHGGYKEEIEIS